MCTPHIFRGWTKEDALRKAERFILSNPEKELEMEEPVNNELPSMFKSWSVIVQEYN